MNIRDINLDDIIDNQVVLGDAIIGQITGESPSYDGARRVAAAWASGDRSPEVSWSVHQVLRNAGTQFQVRLCSHAEQR